MKQRSMIATTTTTITTATATSLMPLALLSGHAPATRCRVEYRLQCHVQRAEPAHCGWGIAA